MEPIQDNPGTAASLSDAIERRQDFAHFNLNLRATEMAALQNFGINKAEYHENFGELDKLPNQMSDFFVSLGNTSDVACCVSQIVTRLTDETISAFSTETAMVLARASLPCPYYDIPRWHPDRNVFTVYEGVHHKVAATLLGPGTLFTRLTKQAMEEIGTRIQRIEREYGGGRSLAQANLEERMELAEIVRAGGFVEAAPAGHGSLFTIDSPDAAIHSEPPINEPRLFVSIVPGNRKQISALAALSWHQSNAQLIPQ